MFDCTEERGARYRHYSIRLNGRPQPFGGIFFGARGDRKALVVEAVAALNAALSLGRSWAYVLGAQERVAVTWDERALAGERQVSIQRVNARPSANSRYRDLWRGERGKAVVAHSPHAVLLDLRRRVPVGPGEPLPEDPIFGPASPWRWVVYHTTTRFGGEWSAFRSRKAALVRLGEPWQLGGIE